MYMYFQMALTMFICLSEIIIHIEVLLLNQDHAHMNGIGISDKEFFDWTIKY